MKFKEYIVTIRIHDDFPIRVAAYSEEDAWHQAARRVQDMHYKDIRVGNSFVLTRMKLEEVTECSGA